MSKIKLPNVFTKDHWVYKKHKDNYDLDKFIGQPYISYSTSESFIDYFEDFVKQKFAGIKLPSSVYAEFGSWVGTSLEEGVIQDNNNGFEGQENILKIDRPDGAIYERPVFIQFDGYFFMGFIDIFKETSKNHCTVKDYKTGGKNKESKYKSKEYTQCVLYAYALEQEGYTIDSIGVEFLRRVGSHVNPPLKLSDEQFYIPLEYNKERVDYALKRLKTNVKDISDLYKTYLKVFGDEQKI